MLKLQIGQISIMSKSDLMFKLQIGQILTMSKSFLMLKLTIGQILTMSKSDLSWVWAWFQAKYMYMPYLMSFAQRIAEKMSEKFKLISDSFILISNTDDFIKLLYHRVVVEK